MPELPDIDVYVTALDQHIVGHKLVSIRLGNAFLLRSVSPSPTIVHGEVVVAVRRIGKRIAINFENDIWLVIHLMIAGRLHWTATQVSLRGKHAIAALDFNNGSVLLTEAATKKRASLHVVHGKSALAEHDPGGLEPLHCDQHQFRAVLIRENHTLKRALTDPRLFSGIGNAYSDEILHAAGLSPVLLSQKLDDKQILRLYQATVSTLSMWRERLMHDAGGTFPENVTAFRDDMSVHGRFGKPCPTCGEPIQRIRYKSNETNYCARCQTGSRILKDRSLSRLLKQDWPKTLDEL